MSVPCRVVTNGKRCAARARRQHLPRQHRAHRMRNRVVHVQQVEIVELRDLRHARRQRQIVRRIVEQRITRDFDFVIMNVRFRAPQPDRLGVRDEMNFVAALGQFQAQFRGHHAAAAVGRITGDPNLHVRSCLRSLCDSMARTERWLQILHEELLDRGSMGTAATGRLSGQKPMPGSILSRCAWNRFFCSSVHAGEFNAHAYSGIAGANHGAGREALFSHPEIDSQRGPDGQWHDRLNITTIAADVGGVDPQWSVDAFVAQFQRKRNLVADEFSAIVVRELVRSSTFISAGSAAVHGQS